jgi:hypothetical protein
MEQRRKDLLAYCIFDLELFAGFDEVVSFSGDAALASLYIDALLIRATGQMPCMEVTEVEYRDEGTQMCRGIAKYSDAKKYFTTGDPHGWLFGKEYSAIMTGSPSDIAYIGAVLPASIGLRAEGRWRTRYALTGQATTSDEREALAAIIRRSRQHC